MPGARGGRWRLMDKSREPPLSLRMLRCGRRELAVSTGFNCGAWCVSGWLQGHITVEKSPQLHPAVLEPGGGPLKEVARSL